MTNEDNIDLPGLRDADHRDGDRGSPAWPEPLQSGAPVSAGLISGLRDARPGRPTHDGRAGHARRWLTGRRPAGKNLTTVYVTHGHGDHWFGLRSGPRALPQRCGHVATPAGDRGHAQSGPRPRHSRHSWLPRFPGQIPEDNPVADPLDGAFFELEGHPRAPVNVGHTDTDDTRPVLHVPDIGLVVAGDAVYNDVHQYLAESRLARTPGLARGARHHRGTGPRAVVAGHKRYGKDRQPAHHRRNPPNTSATSTGSTRKPPRQKNCIGRRRQLTRNRVNPGALWALGAVGKGLNQ